MREAVVGPQAPQPFRLNAYERMATAPRWMLWREVRRQGKSKPDKVPYYTDGTPRGQTDTSEDTAKLVPYHMAKDALDVLGTGWSLAFALGPDGAGGHWQGIDLDDVEANHLGREANSAPGYVEMSPSGKGAHAIGYGRSFPALGSNGSGVEAYSGGRFFTVTERAIRNEDLPCLADFVEKALSPRHGASRLSMPLGQGVEEVAVDPKTVTELRSALLSMRADDYHLWIALGMALRELGSVGRGLWLEWSATSEKFDPKQAAKKWDGFAPRGTGYQVVFKRAQENGWINPASKAAQLENANPSAAATAPRRLVGRLLGDVAMRAIDWLWVGWIPRGYITIFAGETGAGKSTVLADITARITTGAPWPGEFSTVPNEPGRVLWLGSEDSIEEMTVPRLRACGANLNNVVEIQGVSENGKRNTFSMQDDLEAVSEWLTFARAEGRPFAMLVIDPVTSYLPGQKVRKVDMNDAGQLRSVVEPWLVLAQRHNIAIVCVTHFAKDVTRSMLHRVLGSTAFVQTCRSLCAVIQRPTPRDEEPEPHAKALVQVKANLPEHPDGAWMFSTQKVELGTDPRNGRPIAATRPIWERLDSGLKPDSILGGSRGPVSKTDAAFGMWLQAHFTSYPPGEWVRVELVKLAAERDKACSERWWNGHSGEYLDKKNEGGFWFCRLKGTAKETP